MNTFWQPNLIMNISTIEIRNKFLEFFESNNHLRIGNSSIVPKNDPTLLFINAGMAPLKRYFTGEEKPPCPRLCNVQPCIRTIDLDEVGDRHHLTSFQMLGSWSINDYFKKEAISLAFRFLTESLEISKDKLYVTIFAGDDELGLGEDLEAKQYWKEAGIDESHIVSCGKDDNFWGPTAETGPCGPCTEVFYDTGEGIEYVPGGEFDTKSRYIEIWNAGVFMQFNKQADGTYKKLSFTSVDTGAGLERLGMVLGGYSSVYETDLLRPIRDCIEEQLNGKSMPERDILILTDHLRTLALILSEKVRPSNEGRGYIPRKLIRKCLLIAEKAKEKEFNFNKVLEFILDKYKDLFPTFKENREFIINEFNKESGQFSKVLSEGFKKLREIKSTGKITAEEAFELRTTYGLPFEITKDFARDNDLDLDEEGFNKLFEHHKDISKQVQGNLSSGGSNIKNMEILQGLQRTDFVGYDKLTENAKVNNIIVEGEFKESAKAGDEILLILDKTSFYAESGGQCADKGEISNDNFKMDLEDVQKTNEGVFVHIGKISSGEIKVGDIVKTEVDKDIRQMIANNHSAVHLLHRALKETFGKELNQAGSKVDKDRLRFDFNCDSKIDMQHIFAIEKLVNSYIRSNVALDVQEKSLEEALKEDVMALFENKYSDVVRVVNFGDISHELCGGTHTSYTGNIGLFIILNAEGIGKGIKRITAVTGEEALNYINNERAIINDTSAILKVKPDGIIKKLEGINLSKKHEESGKIREADIRYIQSDKGIKYAIVISDSFEKVPREEIMELTDRVDGLTIFVLNKEIKNLCICTSCNREKEYNSQSILKKVIANIGGKGGGNARFASAGGIKGIEADEIVNEVIKNI